jgi:hypothetical protein
MSMIEREKGMNKLKAAQRWSRSATEPARPRRRGDRVSAKVRRRDFITLPATSPLGARGHLLWGNSP